MRKLKNDFGNKLASGDDYYDIFEDWDLIEASFVQQYGIRLRHERYMPWGEFTTLLSGLNYKTPFGQIVSIRSEKDHERLKLFTPEQKRIRNEWLTKKAKEKVKDDPNLAKKQLRDFQAALKAAFFSSGERGE